MEVGKSIYFVKTLFRNVFRNFGEVSRNPFQSLSKITSKIIGFETPKITEMTLYLSVGETHGDANSDNFTYLGPRVLRKKTNLHQSTSGL